MCQEKPAYYLSQGALIKMLYGAFIFIGLIGAMVIKGSLSFAFTDKVWNKPSNGCYQTMFAVPRIKEFFCSDKFLHPPENR
jgi:hypothetical protein